MASNYALQTRSSAEDPVFGNYLDQLPSNKLPTKTEIYRHFLYKRESKIDRLYQRNKKTVKSIDSTTRNKIVHEIVENLKQIWWIGASIPVREDEVLFIDVKNLITKGSELAKNSSSVKSLGRDEFLKRKGFDVILDISRCRLVGYCSHDTVWKVENFSVSQILREMNVVISKV